MTGLIGWTLDSTWLTSISPRFPRLNPNTSVGLLLASGSLLALERPGAPPGERRAGQLLAALAGLVGLATLVEYAGNVDLGIDRLLVPMHACDGIALCARPSTSAAAALVLLSASLLTLDLRTPRGRRPAQLFAALVGFSSVVALAGYVYGVPPLYGLPGHLPYTGLSVYATIALMALAVGVFCARPRAGVMSVVVSGHAGGSVARRFLVLVLLAPVVGVLVTIGETAGAYAPETSAALIAVLAMALAIAWVLRTARALDASDRALRATEKRHRTFVEHASEAIFIADMTGRYVDVNPAATELLGYSREELLGMGITDLIAPEQFPALEESRERLLQGHRDRREWSLRAKDGVLIPVEVTATISPDGQWQASVRDIRERKRIEQIEDQNVHRLAVTSEASLVFSEALADIPVSGFEAVLRAIAEEARIATDADGATLDVAEDPTAAMPPLSISVGARGDVARGLTASVRIGERELGMLSVSRAIDTPPFEADDGTMLNALAPRAALAIEAARSYAREVEGRARLQALLDNMPAGVAFVGPDGGTPVRNRFLDDFLDGLELERDEHPLQRALRTRERVVERMTLRRRDGASIPVLVTAAPVSAGLEGARGAVATFHDISAIEELERFREEWNTIVAHELRQPLNRIGLAVQLLERTADVPEAALSTVHRIRTAVHRLDRMIVDLSDVSRLDAHRLELSLRPVHLRALLEDCATQLHEAVHVTERGQAARAITIDPVRMDQVIGNLLSNAAKYRRPGTPIELDLEWRDDEVVVSVTNVTGASPLSEEDATHVFDRFARAEAAARTGIPGLGVGLYITRGLVEAHGGRIWVDTSPPDRTSFRFALPLEPEARAKSGLRRAAPTTEAVGAPPPSRRHR